MSAPADHMIAALCPLYEDMALGTPLPLPKVFLEVFIAPPLVFGQLALFAEGNIAFWAPEIPSRDIDDALAVLGGAKFEVGVVNGLLPVGVASVPLLGFIGQPVEDSPLGVQHRRAPLLRTGHLAHRVYSVDAVCVEALYAEYVLAAADTFELVSLVGLLAELALGTDDGVVEDEVGNAHSYPIAGPVFV